MKKGNEDAKTCSNPGCGRPAEGNGPLCASCDLEWSLFHREIRSHEDSRLSPPPPSGSDEALPVS
jgi:hypothetical protein